MNALVGISVHVIRALKKLYVKRWLSLVVFFAVFVSSIGVLGRMDLLPDPPKKSEPPVTLAASAVEAATTTTAVAPVATPELPVKIVIPKIGLTKPISNPTTTNANTLDSLLLQGAVRYPTSAELGVNGNVVIFGHSSYLPIVNDDAYKTFDGIQKLVAGDIITIYSSDKVYTYRVRTMQKESIDDAIIPLSVSGQVLTLSTCNSFTGTKTDRFVVTADLVGSQAI